MIELQMVRRMAKKGVFLAAIVAVVLWAWQGPFYAWSSLVGAALTVGNLWLSARIIGATAEKNPRMLLPVGLATFTLGLLLLTAISAVLMLTDLIYFPATGFTLIGMHFALVLSEAAGTKKREPTKIEPSQGGLGDPVSRARPAGFPVSESEEPTLVGSSVGERNKRS